MRADVARNAAPMLYGELHRYLTVVAHWLGFRVAEVSVQHHERLHGSTKYGLARFWRGFVDLLTVRFLMSYESRPSHLFSGLGLASGGRRARPRLPVRREGLRRGDRRPAAADRRGRPGAGWSAAGPLRPARRARRLLPATRTGVTGRRAGRRGWGPRHGPGGGERGGPRRRHGARGPRRHADRCHTDEPIHVMRLRNFFDTGWYALDWDYTGAGPGGTAPTPTSTRPSPCCCCTAGRCCGASRAGARSPPRPHAYHIRHLGVVVIGLVGVAAVAGIGRVLLRLALGAGRGGGAGRADVDRSRDVQRQGRPGRDRAHPLSPWPGPVRAGRSARWPVRRRPGRRLVAGLVLTLGTRPGMWSGLTVLLAVAVVGVLFGAPTRRRLVTWPSWPAPAPSPPPRWSPSTRGSSAHRCGRCRAPASPRRASSTARSRTGSTCRGTSSRRCRRCFAVRAGRDGRRGRRLCGTTAAQWVPAPGSRWSVCRRSPCRSSRSCWAPTSTTGCASCSSRSRRSPSWRRSAWRGARLAAAWRRRLVRWWRARRWCCRPPTR